MTDAQNQIIGLLKEIRAATGGGSSDVNWGHILGTLGDQTDLSNALALKQSAAQVQALIDAAVPYKVYTALLTQADTNAPVATVLQNTTGATFTWAYIDSGSYSLLADSGTPFVALKTGVILGGPVDNTPSYILAKTWISETEIDITVRRASDFTGRDNALSNILFEIRIYP